MTAKTSVFRIISVLMILSMLLAACSTATSTTVAEPTKAAEPAQPQAAEPTTEQAPAPTATQAPEKKEPVTLTFMFWGRPEAVDLWQSIVDEFRANGHENVTINFIHQPDEYDTKLKTLIAGNEAPDIVLMNDGMTANYMSQGLLVDQTPLYSAAGIDPYQEYVKPAIKVNNGQIGCVAYGVHTMMMYYNKSVFDAAGVAYPPADPAQAWTWDQFVETAKKLTTGEGENKTYGVHALPWPTLWRVWVESNGGAYYNEDLTKVTLDSPEAVEALQKEADLRLGLGVAPALGVVDSLGWDIFLQGNRSAMFIDGTFDLQLMKEWWGDDMDVAALPKMGDQYVTHAIVDCPVIMNSSKHPQEAFEFVRYMTDPSNMISYFQSGEFGVPAMKSWLEGETLNSWLDNSGLPSNYETTLIGNMNYTGTNPEAISPKHSSIEWPVIMPYVFKVFNGEITAEEGMKSAAEEANKVLSQK